MNVLKGKGELASVIRRSIFDCHVTFPKVKPPSGIHVSSRLNIVLIFFLFRLYLTAKSSLLIFMATLAYPPLVDHKDPC